MSHEDSPDKQRIVKALGDLLGHLPKHALHLGHQQPEPAEAEFEVSDEALGNFLQDALADYAAADPYTSVEPLAASAYDPPKSQISKALQQVLADVPRDTDKDAFIPCFTAVPMELHGDHKSSLTTDVGIVVRALLLPVVTKSHESRCSWYRFKEKSMRKQKGYATQQASIRSASSLSLIKRA